MEAVATATQRSADIPVCRFADIPVGWATPRSSHGL